jgi:hypothetical protein
MAGGVPSTLFVTRLAQLITIARRSPLGAYQYIVHLGLNGGMPNLLRSLRRQSPHRRALRGGLERFRALT